MGDSLVTVVTIMIAAILLFLFPMMTLADRTDDISQITVQTATASFVDEVRETGKLTNENYAAYSQKIESTGNKFQIDMELQKLDENPAKKAAYEQSTIIGENTYYSLYTSQIEEELDENGIIYLKQGDLFSASCINVSQTLSASMKKFFYKVTGNSLYTISAQHSGIVLVDGQ